MRSYLVYGLIDPRSKELRYVGLTMTSLQFRMYQHLRDARVGVQRRCARWLKGLLAANLAPEVEVLEVCQSAETMVEAERHHIAYFRSIGCNLTNLTDGGDGTFGYHHTSAAKAAQANAKWGNKNALGFKHSAESRLNMSAAAVARGISAETRKKITDAKRGSRLSENHRANIAKAVTRRPVVDECGVVYSSILAASKATNIDHGSIARSARGVCRAQGHSFRFVEA